MKLIEGRKCGDCTVCCDVLEVDEEILQKPANQRCEHRSERGCGIHPNRPYICQQWFCMWRWFPFADSVRPDKSNILISYEVHPEHKRQVLIVRDISQDGAAFEQPGFEHIILSMLEQGIEVICKSRDGSIHQTNPDEIFSSIHIKQL